MSKQAGKTKTPRSLAATLTTAFLVLSSATVLVVILSLFFLIGRAIQDSINSQQQLAAQEAANTVASFVQQKFSVLETTVKLGDPTDASLEEQKRTLQDLLGLDRAFRQSILFDSQGQELAKMSRISQAAAEQLLARIDTDLFAQTRQGNRYISSVYIDEATSEPLVIMAVPAVDILGDFQGTLLAEVNLKFMWDLVDRLKVGETGLAYVVDRQGNLLALGDISRVLRGENVSRLDTVGRFMRSPVSVDLVATSISRGINGTNIVGTYVSLGVPDWAVVTEVPFGEAYRSAIQSAAVAIFVLLVVAFLAALSAVYLARRLARPVLNLTATAGRIAAGEIDLQAAVEGPAETASLAAAFNTMTAQLRTFIGGLEQRVAERTHDLRQRSTYLEATADISRAATSILDPEQLIAETVDLIRERLDLYYVGLFLADERREWAVLRAGSGEAGQTMLARGYRIPLGQAPSGMIGWSIQHAEARVALDADKDQVRLVAEELPETRSEAALPLRSRGQVLGALSVQSKELAAFDQDTVAVLQTMADQVAVALDNARLFAESQSVLEATREAYGQVTSQAWHELLRAQPDIGFRRDRQGLAPVGDTWHPEMAHVMRAGTTLSEQASVATPIKVRGQVIGVIDAHKPEAAGHWTAQEVHVIETLADQLGVALEGARLFRDARRHAAHEQAVRRVTEEMRRGQDMESILRTTVAELGRVLGVPRAYVRLATPPQQAATSGENQNPHQGTELEGSDG